MIKESPHLEFVMGKPKRQKKGRATAEDFDQYVIAMTPDRLQSYLDSSRRSGAHQSAKHAGRNTKTATAWKREGSIAA